jgi:hypothetical protein
MVLQLFIVTYTDWISILLGKYLCYKIVSCYEIIHCSTNVIVFIINDFESTAQPYAQDELRTGNLMAMKKY